MALLSLAVPAPPAPPPLGFLVGGFVLMVVGLGAITARRGAPAPLASAHGTRRALLYVLGYALSAASFARLLSPALLGHETSPWLLALGDVIFVTLGLFIWVMVLAEGYPLADYGFRGASPARFALTLALGLGVAAVYAARPALALLSGESRPAADNLVFALVAASIGTTLPEEILFRGYLQGSLTGRIRRWGGIVAPAVAFAVHRSLWYLPGADLDWGGWLSYVFRVALPLGLWWGLMRDLARGSLWPVLATRFALQFVTLLARTSPGSPLHGP